MYAQSAHQTYRQHQVNSASPLDLLLMNYDAAIAACGQLDLERSTRAIGMLRDSLVFEYDPSFALGLFRLYQWCMELCREHKYEEAAVLLRDLRDTWAQVKAQMERPAAPMAFQPAAGANPYARVAV